MKQSQVIILLIVAACVGISAAKPTLRPLLGEWLDQQDAAQVASSSESEYSDYPALEHEVVCLKETKIDNCRCVSCNTTNTTSCCKLSYFESFFTCCNGIQTRGNYYYTDDDDDITVPAPTINIGSCDTQATLFDTPINANDDGSVKKIGVFTKTCNVAHGNLCGAPFCDGLMWTQSGVIMAMNAYADKNPATGAPSPNCLATRGNDAGVGLEAKIMGGYGSYDDSYGPTPPSPPPAPTTYYTGPVEVYNGPITIYSRKHHFKYHFGTAEYTYWKGPTNTTTTKPDGFKVNPWTYTIKMVKPQGYN